MAWILLVWPLFRKTDRIESRDERHLMQTQPSTTASAQPSGLPPRVLLVDDDQLMRITLAAMLSDSGYRVETAVSSDEALSLVSDLPDLALVIADHHLPGETGLDLLGRLERSRPALGRLLLTGRPDLDRIFPALEGGTITRFFTKPIEPEAFLRSVALLAGGEASPAETF